MKRWDRLSRGFRQLRWGVSVFTGTLSMAAGIFTAGTGAAVPPVEDQQAGLDSAGSVDRRRVPGRLRATRRLERSRLRRRT